MTRLRLSVTAKDDLRDIRTYSKAAFGVAITKDYMAGLRRTFGLLRDRPHAGAIDEGLGQNIRKFVYRSHRIFYAIESETLIVVRILHHARDAGRAFRQ